jgi:hypothetical protein
MRWSPVKPMSCFEIKIRYFLILISIPCLSMPGISLADSWSKPSTREYPSSNGNCVVIIEPAAKEFRAMATVYRIGSEGRSFLWNTDLVNSVAPLDAFVTDDGRYVITLDNWYRDGYGDDVLVFYKNGGEIKRYSLEEIASEFVKEKELKNLYKQFAHSRSSRIWRGYSIIQIDESQDPPLFGIWLNWTQRWFVWRLDTGKPIQVNISEKLRWDGIGRKWSHEQLANDIRVVTACYYLAYLRNPKDRGLIEDRLKSKDYSQSGDNTYFPIRQAADRALAFWDGLVDNCNDGNIINSDHDKLYFLGEVNISVQLPYLPQRENSQIALMIFPGNWQGQVWEQSKPEYKLSKHFKFGVANNIDKKILFRLNGITPGKYWIKVLWDKTPPFKYDLFYYDPAHKWYATELPDLTLAPGDFESNGWETFTVQASQKVEVTVGCTIPVDPYLYEWGK